VNKANDPPEQKVKGSGSGVFKALSGYPDKAFSSFLGVLA
jgi:hypothetical protein